MGNFKNMQSCLGDKWKNQEPNATVISGNDDEDYKSSGELMSENDVDRMKHLAGIPKKYPAKGFNPNDEDYSDTTPDEHECPNCGASGDTIRYSHTSDNARKCSACGTKVGRLPHEPYSTNAPKQDDLDDDGFYINKHDPNREQYGFDDDRDDDYDYSDDDIEPQLHLQFEAYKKRMQHP